MRHLIDEEDEVVDLMQSLDQRVFDYLVGYMDIGTGVIGVNQALSYSGIASALSEVEGAGREKHKWISVKREDVRNSVRRLIKAGIFRGKSEGKKLMLERVFWVDLLSLVRSVQNEVTTTLPHSVPSKIKIISWLFRDLHDYKDKGYHTGYRNVTTYNKHTYIHTDVENKFSMTTSWKPDAIFLNEFLSLYGCKVEQIEIDWFAEFVSFWEGKPDVLRSSREWVKRYVKDMVVYIRNPLLFKSRHGIPNKPNIAVVRGSANKSGELDISHSSHKEFKKSAEGKIPENISAIIGNILSDMKK